MPCDQDRVASRYLGLAPFLRRSIAGLDLRAYAQELLVQASLAPLDANHLMNLAIATQCLGQREAGLALQRQALLRQQTYYLPAAVRPARLQVLLLVVEGELSANTPLDCLFEHSDLDLVVHYVNSDTLPKLPAHDVLMVGIGVSSQSVALLQELKSMLLRWPKPVINPPEQILRTDRATASRLLQGVPGMLMPPTCRFQREQLSALASGQRRLVELIASSDSSNRVNAFDFPIIIRPVNSQGGEKLELVHGNDQLAAYLSHADAAEFFLAPFIDYRHEDGYFRKIRVALVAGEPFVCHMAVSSHWMVHYVNAGMYEEAWKREEESAFMSHFSEFAKRHATALRAIYERTGLDYLCIDCAQTQDGQLLIFEIDHAMVIHAMDLETQFPFKQIHMQKVQYALRNHLLHASAHEAQQRA